MIRHSMVLFFFHKKQKKRWESKGAHCSVGTIPDGCLDRSTGWLPSIAWSAIFPSQISPILALLIKIYILSSNFTHHTKIFPPNLLPLISDKNNQTTGENHRNIVEKMIRSSKIEMIRSKSQLFSTCKPRPATI